MLPRSLPVLHAFFAVPVLRTFTSHKKLNRHSRLYAGPPLLSEADAFLNRVSFEVLSFGEGWVRLFPVSRTASGEIRQNDGGLVRGRA